MRKINFRKNPYKGILKEVADDRNISRSAVWQQLRNNSPEIIKAVNKKIEEREKIAADNPLKGV